MGIRINGLTLVLYEEWKGGFDRQRQINACPVYVWWAFTVKKSAKTSKGLLKATVFGLGHCLSKDKRQDVLEIWGHSIFAPTPWLRLCMGVGYFFSGVPGQLWIFPGFIQKEYCRTEGAKSNEILFYPLET